jgi:hypothetical protein
MTCTWCLTTAGYEQHNVDGPWQQMASDASLAFGDGTGRCMPPAMQARELQGLQPQTWPFSLSTTCFLVLKV